MIRWVCDVTTKEQVNLQNLLERMQLDDLEKVLSIRRIRWHGDVERCDGCLNEIQRHNHIECRGCGRLKKTWLEVIRLDCLALGLRPNFPTARLGVVHLEIS